MENIKVTMIRVFSISWVMCCTRRSEHFQTTHLPQANLFVGVVAFNAANNLKQAKDYDNLEHFGHIFLQ